MPPDPLVYEYLHFRFKAPTKDALRGSCIRISLPLDRNSLHSFLGGAGWCAVYITSWNWSKYSWKITLAQKKRVRTGRGDTLSGLIWIWYIDGWFPSVDKMEEADSKSKLSGDEGSGFHGKNGFVKCVTTSQGETTAIPSPSGKTWGGRISKSTKRVIMCASCQYLLV